MRVVRFMPEEQTPAPRAREAARMRAARMHRPYGAPGHEALALMIGVAVALVVMVALIAYLWA